MPSLTIRLKKGRDSPSVLTCIRADGSSTWHRLHPVFPWHDLAHYAVETTLGLRDGFLGLVARGWDLSAFEKPEARRGLPAEAVWVEFVVGLLLAEVSDGREASGDEFRATLEKAIAGKLEAPRGAPSDEEIARIRAMILELHGRFAALPPGQTLELLFHSPESG
jgi:hypothetical protein